MVCGYKISRILRSCSVFSRISCTSNSVLYPDINLSWINLPAVFRIRIGSGFSNDKKTLNEREDEARRFWHENYLKQRNQHKNC
jgi:hypothetical protein